MPAKKKPALESDPTAEVEALADDPVDDARAPEPTPETSDESDQPSEDSEETEPPKRPPLRERLGEFSDDDWKELLEDDRIKGRVGQIADRRAKELLREEDEREKREAKERADREEIERLRRLRKTDLKAYNEEMDAREANEAYERQEAERSRALLNVFTEKLAVKVKNKFGESTAQKFATRSYNDLPFTDGVLQYIDDLVEEERAITRRELEKELRPAIRKQILTEMNGGEPPEPANGGRGKPKSQQDFQTELEVSQALAEGRISKEEMVQWFRTHPTAWRR